LVLDEIEGKHRAILVRRRDALKALASRAAETLKEVKSRLAVLDDEYGFIRTSIFWVRDQDPIGPESVGQGGREVARLGKAIFRLAEEAVDARNWSRVSAEFTAAAVGLVVLPFGLFRIRRQLSEQIAIHLPDPETVSEPSASTPDIDPTLSQPPQVEPD
jgi:potassium efflux system protein